MNRFADIDFAFINIENTHEFHGNKLVSLERALEPIVSQIDGLSDHIQTAKRNCHYPSEHGLTVDESAAVYVYTMEWGDKSLNRVLNQVLRSEDRESLNGWFSYLKLFDTALEKLPTAKEVIWRGVPLDIGMHFTKDKILTWWSISSCSLSLDVITNFLDDKAKSTLFLIEPKNGKIISPYSACATEDEVILRIGTKLRVKSNAWNHPQGSHIVHLIEVDDDKSKPLRASGIMNVKAKPSNAQASSKLFMIFIKELRFYLEVKSSNSITQPAAKKVPKKSESD